MEDISFQNMVDTRRVKRMNAIDRMPKELRELVHEYGLSIVKTFMDLGVTKPKQIKHAVETVLDEFSPSRGTYSKQGKRTEARPQY